MIKIRRSVFETNSSSSHCLSIEEGNNNIDLSSIKLTITPYTKEEITQPMVIDKLEDKLRYLYTVYLQEYEEDDMVDKVKLMPTLKEILPNVTFINKGEKYIYVFEDGEYLFSEYGGLEELQNWIDNKDKLIQFLKNGKVIFWNRDDEDQNDTYIPIKRNDNVIYFMG